MLRLLNEQRTVMPPLMNYKNLKIDRVLEYDYSTLSFDISVKLLPEYLKLENYIQTQTEEYVIKSIEISGDTASVICDVNIDELEGNFFEKFETKRKTAKECAEFALAGTGWLVECDLEKKRTIKVTNKYVWDIIKQIASAYRLELKIDSINKILTFVEHRGDDKGVYFSDSLNLKKINIKTDTEDFYTRLIPMGKDGLTIESVNEGKKYIENYQYSNKIKVYYWKDERYTIAENLKEDAQAKLNDLSKPYIAYSCEVIDLANAGDKKYEILSYNIGDTVTLLDSLTNIREKQRIVKITEYPEEPEKNTCELANTVISFEEYAQKYEDASSTVDNITTDNGTIDGDCIDNIPASKVLNLDEVIANSAKFVEVSTQILNVSDQLNAANAKIGTLETTMLTATQADLKYATIENLTVATGRIETLETNALTAGSALIHSLTSDVANINTLMFGTASGGSLTTEFSNTVVGLIGDAQIKSAMIKDITADKITSGKLYTNLVEVVSQSGNLDISDNTIQIRDDAQTARVQIGKDAAGDYNIYIWDKSGKLMFDPLYGIQEDGIKSAVIRNDMISETANISAKKLDISSLITEINGSTETIKANRIYVDADNQTLDVAFKTMSTSVTTATTTANTALSSAVSAENAVNGLQIGGRNLYTGTKDFNTSWENIYLWSTSSEEYEGFIVKERSNAWKGLVQKIPVKVGEIYTFSCYIKNSIAYNYQVLGYISDTFGIDYDILSNTFDGSVTGEWNRYAMTIKITKVEDGHYMRFGVEPNSVGGTVKVCGLKLEYGTKATDWSPAPEDVDSSISAVDARVTTLTETVSTQGTQITTVQGQISSKVWQQDITTAVTELEIGGRNLFHGSQKFNITNAKSFGSSNSWITDETYNGLTVRRYGYSWNFYRPTISLGPGNYVFSGYAKGTNNKVLFLQAAVGDIVLNYDAHNVTNDWKRYGITFKLAEKSDVTFYFELRENGGDIYECGWKLEKGDKSTDWSPAPEDVDSSLVALEGTTTTLTNQYTEVKQTLSGLSAEVAANKTTIATKADGSVVTELQSDVTRIDAGLNGFASHVSSTYSTKAELNSLDGKFDNYSTTTQMNSAIEQKAGNILLEVSGTYATQDSLGNYATTQSVTASLALKIDKTDNNQIISMINASADVIRLTADRFVLDSTYSKINQDGTVQFTGGNIGGFAIDGNGLFNVQDGVGCGIQKYGQGSAFWAGAGGVGNGGENAEFRVWHDGSVFAQKMYITGGSLNINDNLIIDASGNLTAKGSADFQCSTVYANDFHSRGSMYIENSLDVGGTTGCNTLLVKDNMYVSNVFYYWYNGAWVTLRGYISAIINGG